MEERNMSEVRNLPEEQEIDLMELVSKLWKSRKMILLWCLVGAFIGLVAAFSIPKTYSVKAVLTPETQSRVGSGVSSIASMMGVSLDNSKDAIDVDLYPDVVASTPFMFKLTDLPVKTRNGQLETTLEDYILHHQKKPWWNYIINAPMKAVGWAVGLVRRPEKEEVQVDTTLDISNLPKEKRMVIKYLARAVQVNVDVKTGKTRLSLQMQDPYVAAAVLDAVVNNLKSYMYDYRTSKARQDVENLTKICEERKLEYYAAHDAYAMITDANKHVVRNSTKAEFQRVQQEVNLAYQVYSQVATQLEGARIKVQQSKPVFAVLEPVTVPIRPSGPGKIKLLAIFTFLAGCCAAVWVLFGKDFVAQVKEKFQ